MVAARASWKGFIKFGEVACAVALYSATSSSERIAFNTLNRATGNRVHREFVDSETGDPVERDDQVKGYEIENGDYVVLEPDEVAAAIPTGFDHSWRSARAYAIPGGQAVAASKLDGLPGTFMPFTSPVVDDCPSCR